MATDNTRIICVIHEGSAIQNVAVYTNREFVVSVPSTVEDLPDTILSLCQHYNTQQVNFIGNVEYNKKFGELLTEANTLQYNVSNLEINYI